MVKRSILCGVIGGTILCVPLILIGFLPFLDGMINWLVYSNVIVGGALTFAAGIGIAIFVGDDATGIGVVDDAIIPMFISLFYEGIEMVNG